jgi:CRP-like cAMP-binding protein
MQAVVRQSPVSLQDVVIHFYPVDLHGFLGRLSARSVLSDRERDAILALPTERQLIRAKHDIVQLKEEVDHSCYVAAGLVARFSLVRSGARQIVALHLPGDMADLHSAVRPIGLGGLTALCDCTILRIPHDPIRALGARYPAVAEALWRDCMLDAAILMEWLSNLGRRGAAARVAHLICELSLRYGRDKGMLTQFDLPITQEQVSDVLGLTGVHINRSLRTLREIELVTFSKGRVEIGDLPALMRLAEFDPAYLVADTAPKRQKRLFE